MGLSVSCSQDEMADAPKGDELPAVSYAVSAEEALAGWQNIPDGMRTRGKARTVADVQTLYGSEMTATRTAGEDAPLGYVVNFEEGGYAVLGADLRQDPVVAVVNENSMTPRTLAAAKRAVDAGEEVDAPTFVNAMVADYLVRSLDNNEPRPRIGSWEIKENKGSMMLTKWGPDGVYGDDLNPATVAICRILGCNERFGRISFDQPGGYIPDWTLLNTAATMKTPTGNCAEEVAKLCSAMDGTIRVAQGSRTTIETIVRIMRSSMREYQLVQSFSVDELGDMYLVSGRIRSMLFENNMPVYVEATTSAGSRHAWVFDGWRMRECPGGSGCQYYVRCNFGWQGVNDGVYSFGNFLGYDENPEFISYNFGD